MFASEKPGIQEIVEADVSEKFLSELDFLDSSLDESEVVHESDESIQINLKKWEEPMDNLVFDPDMRAFCTSFVIRFLETSVDKISDPESLP